MTLYDRQSEVYTAAVTLANALIDWLDAMNDATPDRESSIDKVVIYRHTLREAERAYREMLWQVEERRQTVVDKQFR